MAVEEGSDDACGALVVGVVESGCSRTARHLEKEVRSPAEWSVAPGESFSTMS